MDAVIGPAGSNSKEAVDETATRMTARVIQDISNQHRGIGHGRSTPALLRFNRELLGGSHRHVMFVDSNGDRGIDVAIMTRDGFHIVSIRSKGRSE